ncbi:MAG: hypothetical protein KJO79_04860, partial [Verrucomicrobiae bacterium]|nr:hypothetical protein [Verrucomicrobiae bacterium]NNJ86488.1 hypothetical protein [Akkermansiaceae bacterium]
RGLQDTARLDVDGKSAMLAIKTPYNRGKAVLERTGDAWPEEIKIRFHKKPGTAADPKAVLLGDGENGARADFTVKAQWVTGAAKQPANFRGNWSKKFFDNPEKTKPSGQPVQLDRSDEAFDVILPKFFLKGNPKVIAFEWVA